MSVEHFVTSLDNESMLADGGRFNREVLCRWSPSIFFAHSFSFSLMTETNSSTDECLRPYIDPKLVQRHQHHVDESWLSDFVSPQQAPQGAYSAVAQAVKKFVPERTACRLGCGGARCKYERSDYWNPEQMAIKGIFSHWSLLFSSLSNRTCCVF